MPATRNRIQSIDILRGLVMVIMALDHVRDFFFKGVSAGAAVATDPTNLATTTPALFFTRWITHFCAPVFVFLAGTSIFLMSQKKSKGELSIFLLKRGLWLVFVEIIIITFGWRFDPLFRLFILQVIWAIGISMIILGFLVRLPWKIILLIGFIIVCGHNFLDYPAINQSLKGSFISDIIYFANFSFYPLWSNHTVVIIYAFLPWTGVMLLGYCFGKLYMKGVDPAWRKKILIGIGLGLVLLFLVLRFIDFYGDPVQWSTQSRGGLFTFLSFLNLNKYPPSLLYLCMTLGPAILLLAFIEKMQNWFTRTMSIYGRVPMFYYILHFYLIHLIVVIVFYLSGFTAKDINGPNHIFLFRPPTFGFGLWGVYAVWIFVVIALYPFCKKYDSYKSSNQKWWLSYL
jgi:uncharacterized membrane protein